MLLNGLVGFSWDTTIYSAIIAAVVSILIWLCTIGHDNRKKRKEQQRLDKGNLTYLSFLLLGVLSDTNRQMHVLRKYISEFDDGLNFDYAQLPMMPHLDLQTLSDRIDQEKYFTSYINVYDKNEAQLESIKNIFTTAYYLQLQYGFLQDISNAYYKDEASNSIQMSELFYSALLQIGQLRFQLNDQRIGFFFAIASDFQEKYIVNRKSEADFRSAYQDFIIPLLNVISQDFTHDLFVQDIANILFQAKAIGDRLLKNRGNYKDEMTNWFNSSIVAASSIQKNAMPLIKTYTPVAKDDAAYDTLSTESVG